MKRKIIERINQVNILIVHIYSFKVLPKDSYYDASFLSVRFKVITNSMMKKAKAIRMNSRVCKHFAVYSSEAKSPN